MNKKCCICGKEPRWYNKWINKPFTAKGNHLVAVCVGGSNFWTTEELTFCSKFCFKIRGLRGIEAPVVWTVDTIAKWDGLYF